MAWNGVSAAVIAFRQMNAWPGHQQVTVSSHYDDEVTGSQPLMFM
jgi:hypothetical protein